jgi:hypothetical protein
MGVLMVKCPATGAPISTGMQADRSSFARTPVFFSRTLCPHCRTQHEWFAKDAWVEERPAPRYEAA